MDKSYYQFLAVAEHGSISGAALALNLSQPTLTATIRKLEGQLGVPLLIRKSKGVELTEYGQLLRQQAEEMARRHQRMLDQMADLKARRTQKIKMGTGDAWWELFVKDAIAEYTHGNPAISVDLEFGNHLKLMDLLQHGHIDLFMGHEIIGLSSRYPVSFMPVFQDEEAFYVRENHPLLLSNHPESESYLYPLLRVTPDTEPYRHLLDDLGPKQRENQQKGLGERIVYNVGSLSASIDILKTLPAVMPYPARMKGYFADLGIVPLPLNQSGQKGTVGIYYLHDEQGDHLHALLSMLKERAILMD
ncbi:LysR family transcriptional regulator [Parasalinivibrio latis]|uniref:LysR family transcriptional regulator n=1 Tax=Parasalinivibrio latis TaxID=2952610 RepID=UPI0030E16ADB